MISLGFSVLCLICYEAFAPLLAGIFIEDPATIQYASGFLRIMVTAMPMMSLCYPIIVQFQAMGKAKPALVCSVIRKGILDIPISFVMDALIPLYGLMWVQPIVDTISLAVAGILYRKQNRRG
jgi:Na+-driven multidrug efflux pump